MTIEEVVELMRGMLARVAFVPFADTNSVCGLCLCTFHRFFNRICSRCLFDVSDPRRVHISYCPLIEAYNKT